MLTISPAISAFSHSFNRHTQNSPRDLHDVAIHRFNFIIDIERCLSIIFNSQFLNCVLCIYFWGLQSDEVDVEHDAIKTFLYFKINLSQEQSIQQSIQMGIQPSQGIQAKLSYH